MNGNSYENHIGIYCQCVNALLKTIYWQSRESEICMLRTISIAVKQALMPNIKGKPCYWKQSNTYNYTESLLNFPSVNKDRNKIFFFFLSSSADTLQLNAIDVPYVYIFKSFFSYFGFSRAKDNAKGFTEER